MMRLYEQGSSHRLKALGFRPNYVGGIFYEENLKKNRLLKKGFWYHAAGRCMEGPSFLHIRQSAGVRELKTK